MSKLMTLAAAATGYVLGARAGRERYDQIKTRADKVWNNPKVQETVLDAQVFAEEQAPVAKKKAADAARTASKKTKSAADKAADKAKHTDDGGM